MTDELPRVDAPVMRRPGDAQFVARTLTSAGPNRSAVRSCPRLLRGEVVSALLGFREPDSGSDVAAATVPRVTATTGWSTVRRCSTTKVHGSRTRP